MQVTDKLFNVIDLTRAFVLLEKNGRVFCAQGKVHEIEKLDDIHDVARKNGNDVAFALPYRMIRERGFEAQGNEPILAMEAEVSLSVSREAMMEILPQGEIKLDGGIEPSLSDEDYAALVERFQNTEIEGGNASQTTLARCFTGRITAFDIGTALAIYRRVLQQHGRYMAVLFANINPQDRSKDQFIVGATPERHLEISGNEVLMMPIAGTLRKEDRATFRDRLHSFLDNPKEINELFQVVDEEMKMMGVICPEGGEIEGPILHEIGAVVHTSYRLVGRRSLDSITALRRTLHAPTVVGSPMESAARIIAKYEPISRRYYAGEIGIYRCPRADAPADKRCGDLDAAILIRCAEIDGAGRFRVQAGGGLVRDSVPSEEAKESRAKAMGLLGALTGASQLAETYLTEELIRETRDKFVARNQYLSSFWMNRQHIVEKGESVLDKAKITILNNEDDFAFMLCHILRVFKAEAEVVDSLSFDADKDRSDLVLLGPGPGDPTDMSHPRMKRNQETIGKLKAKGTPMFGVCLGHQALAFYNGLSVLRQPESSQGMQRDVTVRGKAMKLGFYNSFSPVYDKAAEARPEISCDRDENGRIIAMFGDGFMGVQFHPESIMSTQGAEFLYGALARLVKAHA